MKVLKMPLIVTLCVRGLKGGSLQFSRAISSANTRTPVAKDIERRRAVNCAVAFIPQKSTLKLPFFQSSPPLRTSLEVNGNADYSLILIKTSL